MSKNEIFLDNLRAQFALNRIEKFLDENDKNQAEKKIKGYRARSREFPTMISQDLLQTIVFYYSKKNKSGDGYSEFLNDIIDWFDYVKEKNKTDFGLNFNKKNDKILSFIKCLQELDTFTYLLITEELIKVGIWFKLFATALIDQENKNEK